MYSFFNVQSKRARYNKKELKSNNARLEIINLIFNFKKVQYWNPLHL